MAEEYNVWFRAWVRRQQQDEKRGSRENRDMGVSQERPVQGVVLAGSPHSWIGRRVWCRGFQGHQVYGEVVSVDEQSATAQVVVGYGRLGQPLYWVIDWSCFGRSVVFAYE